MCMVMHNVNATKDLMQRMFIVGLFVILIEAMFWCQFTAIPRAGEQDRHVRDRAADEADPGAGGDSAGTVFS